MFSDKYSLTKAVLEGRKRQTRRILKMPNYDEEYLDTAFDWDFREMVISDEYPKYKVGEIVAVAQSYGDISNIISKTPSKERAEFYCKIMKSCYPKDEVARDKHEIAGWNNKMYVKPELMLHFIRITNVRIERLQDISDEDCMAEGIIKWDAGQPDVPFFTYPNAVKCDYDTPQDAYASLIDKVGKKGDWESNPYVLVYDFELVK